MVEEVEGEDIVVEEMEGWCGGLDEGADSWHRRRDRENTLELDTMSVTPSRSTATNTNIYIYKK